MHSPSFETAVRRIRILTAPTPTTLSDRELLTRFLKSQDATAFATLVERHGPMVFGVCRRVLNHEHDAEDAFQATFLVLSRRAAAIQKHGSLSSWLHGVAFRVASKLKVRLSRRPRVGDVPDISQVSRDDMSWREIRRVLDEEVNRLPEHLRLPVLLCYFQGNTRDEAAKALAWKLSTLRGRLEDGRSMLRTRLSKRGVELSAALLATSATCDGSAIADSLIDSTIQNLSTQASETVRSLATGISSGGMMQKLGLTLGTLILVLGIGSTMFPFKGQAGDPPGPVPRTPETSEKGDGLPTEILALMQAADRVWVVDAPTDQVPIPEPLEVLKGQTPPAGYRVHYEVAALKNLPRKGHKLVVFLRSIEEVSHLPKPIPIAGDSWYIPAEEKTLAALRAYVPPCDWGKTDAGLRLGIWPRKDAEEPTVEVVIQNVGTKDVTIPQQRGNFHEHWPYLRFDVTGPDGKTYHLEQIGGPTKDGDAPTERILKAGDRYIHVVRLNRWLRIPDNDRGSMGNAPAGLFASGGDFKVQATYSVTSDRDTSWWLGKLESKPVTITVPKPGLFGQRAGDFRLHLRTPPAIKVSHDPQLQFDLRYSGKQARRVNGNAALTEIGLDGRWYRALSDPEFVGLRVVELKPGSEHSPFAMVIPNRNWFHLRANPGVDDPDAAREAIPFHLTAGSPTLRVAYRFSATERAISNAVTLVVASDGWGKSSGGVKARIRLAKTRFSPGEPLVFEVDLKNTTNRKWTILPIPFNAGIELDGRWYFFQGELDYKSMPKELKANSELKTFVRVESSPEWKTNRLPVKAGNAEFDSLVLTPGKHKVRARFAVEVGKAEPESNIVEFEVDSLDPATRALALGADRIWVVHAPTRAKPIPEVAEVLKGPPLPLVKLFDLRLLPGEDANKKFIVFLRADEDRMSVPELSPAKGERWFQPYDEATAEAIRKAVLPEDWGVEVGGLRTYLRLRSPNAKLGQPIVGEVTIHNNGTTHAEIPQHRLNIYDYWPNLRFEVVAPDGSRWILKKPTTEMEEFDSPHSITLKPGESYVHSVRLDRWPAQSLDTKPPKLLANVFSKDGEYSIAAHWSYRPASATGSVLISSKAKMLNVAK